MARPLALRSLSSQPQKWKQTFLGALAKAGLKTPMAGRLLYHRGLLQVWVGLLPKVDHPIWRRSPDSPAAIRRAELAFAAAIVSKYRVEKTTRLKELGLTSRTSSVCEAAELYTVGDILAHATLPPKWRERFAEGVREELCSLLIAGGIREDKLPSWLLSSS